MFGQNQQSDKELQKTVSKRLERTGTGSQSKVQAVVRRGAVTLTGKLQYERQRSPILKAVQSVAGVRQVIDQLQTPPKVRPHSQPTEHRKPRVDEPVVLEDSPINDIGSIAQDPIPVE
ncbi:BON domain-containing protein [Aeoliella sp. SH292]|uniref:BON domain-containing protein n=1 Tax=Aeoliella sp. SH292 TaxID=3454464 RepID=UPI003F96B9A2